MRLRSPSLWIAVISMIAVAGFVLSDLGRKPSPGPLAEVHAREDDLAGSRDCSACHGGWGQSMTEACLACHEPIGSQIERRAGLHGKLVDAKQLECAFCHSDHHGGDFQIVNTQSFTAAGVADAEKFDHQLVGYAMGGKHLELACEKCHEHANDLVLNQGTHRFGGLETSCVKCHKDPHEGRMALTCADCHGEDDFKKIISRDHDRFLPLVGGHGSASCRDCHEKEQPHALELLGRDVRPLRRECADCHDSPHGRRIVEGVAEFAARTTGASCVECHRPGHEDFAAADAEITRDRHAASGFPLDFPHDLATCEDCHDSRLTTFELRYPGRGPNDCGRCHEDVHRGQFDFGRLELRRCTSCHDPEGFEPHAFTLERHSLTRFPLTGRHVETGCDDCHERPDPKKPRAFHGTPRGCDRCHADAHAGFFAKAAPKEVRARGAACDRCHSTGSFSELPAAGFDHATWTAFALAGAHAQSECESCHERTRKPDASERTFGRVVDRYGKLAGCATCHEDAHHGAFDRPELPREVEGRTGCARCHGESSFRTFATGFDHGRWTGYFLEGGHGNLACAECHAPLAAQDAFGRTTAPARGRECAACHDDPHGGQFLRNAQTDCQRCHRSTTRFAELFFNHNVHSRYRLDETHAKVACSACHKPETLGGVTMVRYRPLGMKCSDCHGAPEDPLRRRKENDE